MPDARFRWVRAVGALKAHRKRVARTEAEDLVFGRLNGEPFRESKILTRVLQPAAQAAGLGKVTLAPVPDTSTRH